jgi:B12-binding domain/radical SAM domain protein of rhizo-twelve system
MRKLGVEAVVLGECEEVLPRLAGDWSAVPGLCFRVNGDFRVTGGPQAARMDTLPALSWPEETIGRHRHHHHRFDLPPAGPGAEVEASRGCPYHCTFCAKDNFRDDYRKRPVETVLAEIDGLAAQGIDYFYFIDEIFLPNKPLLEALVDRRLKFGMQTRIDLWGRELLELAGRAGCVSIEAGVESITEEGRAALDKKCRLSTDELSDRLVFAKRHVAFVQANLLGMQEDDPGAVAAWREHLHAHGVWANEPVPLFVYPGSPEYTLKWGAPDDQAWERAHDDYLRAFSGFSDIQEQRPVPLTQLETQPPGGER